VETWIEEDDVIDIRHEGYGTVRLVYSQLRQGAAWSALLTVSEGMGEGTTLGIEEGGWVIVVSPQAACCGTASPLG